jgi:hypothetical protein
VTSPTVADRAPGRPATPPLRRLLAASRPDLTLAGGLLVWVPLILVVDRGAGIWTQRGIGLLTWAVLLLVLRRESPLTRVQVGIVVAFATAIEYTFSPLLVYLCALTLGRAPLVLAYRRALVWATVVLVGGYALWGVTLSPRLDVLGAFWFVCLLAFLRWGPSSTLYVGAALVVTYLEVLGTAIGTWRWSELDPTGVIPIGNPPSGAAGGYGWFDLAAVLAAPALLAWWRRVRRGSARRERGEGGVVQEPVGREGAAA